MRILFICKKNENYGHSTYTRRSSGLYNSTRFIVESLRNRRVQSNIVEVVDNNDIDREVTAYKPDVVVIEALWVVPEKFDVLKALHPKVRWFCHLHSHMPFLALEGMAIEWILKYAVRGVMLIANSLESYEALRCVLKASEIILLPNVYISVPRKAELNCGSANTDLNIGCFGAVRPLKNHLLQALAAIEFAREMGKPLAFHINASRIETGGSPVLKNLVTLFDSTPNVELIQHGWFEPPDFLNFLQENIDLGMQVSLSETFNVVTADYVTAGLPVVVSKEIPWTSRFNRAEENSIHSIVKVMRRVWDNGPLIAHNQRLLIKNSKAAQNAWFDCFGGA